MGSTPQGPYGKPPSGQPAAMQPGDFQTAAYTSPPFGQRYARIAGVPRKLLVTQPVAGAEWTYKHSGPSWILLRTVVWQLQTAVAAATRASRLQLKYGGDLVAQFPPGATQAASLTVVYTATDFGITSGDPATVCVGLPTDIILGDNMTLGSSTANIQAADQYSLVAIFGEEFSCFDWCDE